MCALVLFKHLLNRKTTSVCNSCLNCKHDHPNFAKMNSGLVPTQTQRLIPMSAIGSEVPKNRAKRSLVKKAKKKKTKPRNKSEVVGFGSKRKCVKPCRKKFKKLKKPKRTAKKKKTRKVNKHGAKTRYLD